MRFLVIYILLLLLAFSYPAIGQNKAVVLQHVWNNELNNYNPKDFLEKLFDLIKARLKVKELVVESQSPGRLVDGWEKNVKEQIKLKKASGQDAYFVAIANDLRLPAFNLGKFLFKNPPRSSKLTFMLHIYDSTGTEVMGDTIINRGCLIKTIDEEKGGKFFYSDYSNFMSDMLCHFEVIRKTIGEKPLTKRQKVYGEAR